MNRSGSPSVRSFNPPCCKSVRTLPELATRSRASIADLGQPNRSRVRGGHTCSPRFQRRNGSANGLAERQATVSDPLDDCHLPVISWQPRQDRKCGKEIARPAAGNSEPESGIKEGSRWHNSACREARACRRRLAGSQKGRGLRIPQQGLPIMGKLRPATRGLSDTALRTHCNATVEPARSGY